MHTPENIIAMADAYIKVIFAGILLTMAYNVLSGILRGIGDSRTPLYFLILSSVLNIILDVVLIVYTGLGTAGSRLRDNHRTGSLRRALLLLYVPEIRYPAHQT